MPPALRPQVYSAVVDDDLVLLDAARDAYLCLPHGGPAWRDVERRRDTPGSRALLAALAEGGLLEPAEVPRAATVRPIPTRGLDVVPPAEVRAADVWRLIWAWLDLLRHYNGRPFDHVLASGASHSSRLKGAVADDVERDRLVRAFLHLVVWLPVSGKCLVRSFLLLRFLHRSGASADWVFGVSVWPFRAHCWLEADGVVLDDAPERLAFYTPILGA